MEEGNRSSPSLVASWSAWEVLPSQITTAFDLALSKLNGPC